MIMMMIMMMMMRVADKRCLCKPLELVTYTDVTDGLFWDRKLSFAERQRAELFSTVLLDDRGYERWAPNSCCDLCAEQMALNGPTLAIACTTELI